MKGIIKVSAALLTAVMLAGGVSEVAYARCGHHSQNVCDPEYAACYQDGVCIGEGCCDEYGVCQYGGNCLGHEGYGQGWGRGSRGHHSGRSHRSGCHR
ncbi:MAG: hypothetical protein HFH80_12635 [Lachnospiraceae bacterium]|nr:hypothetical protein [Lachnospiraceae bacterium]